MSEIEMLMPKVGDMVRLKPWKVSWVDNDGFGFVVTKDGEEMMSHISDLEEILPPPVAVGNCVQKVESSAKAVVIALHKGSAWVRWEGGFDSIESANDLIHCEP